MPKGPEVWRRGPKNFLGGGSFFPTPGGFGFSGSWERSQNLSLGGMGGIKKKKFRPPSASKSCLGGAILTLHIFPALGGQFFVRVGGENPAPWACMIVVSCFVARGLFPLNKNTMKTYGDVPVPYPRANNGLWMALVVVLLTLLQRPPFDGLRDHHIPEELPAICGHLCLLPRLAVVLEREDQGELWSLESVLGDSGDHILGKQEQTLFNDLRKGIGIGTRKFYWKGVPLYSEIETGKNQASSFSQWFQNKEGPPFR